MMKSQNSDAAHQFWVVFLGLRWASKRSTLETGRC